MLHRGRRSAGAMLSVHYLRNRTSPCPRLGIAVGRKTARRAVARNRLKRIVRAAFDARRDTLPPLDIIVVVRPPAVTASRRDFRQTLDAVFSTLTNEY